MLARDTVGCPSSHYRAAACSGAGVGTEGAGGHDVGSGLAFVRVSRATQLLPALRAGCLLAGRPLFDPFLGSVQTRV